MGRYVWQGAQWPIWRWDSDDLLEPLGRSRKAQGRLFARAEYFGLEIEAEVLTEEAFTTAAIEGERLDRNSVRSSVAKRLGLPTAGLQQPDRHVDGLVEMLLDATRCHDLPMNAERLKGWHAALFPTGYSGMMKLTVAGWRSAEVDPMRVVSGAVGRETVHFEAPPAGRVEAEMQRFFAWWKDSHRAMDGLIRAGLAHLWFVTIHPFEDGNGRIARGLADMALAQDEDSGCRLYSMSSQIMKDRDSYYVMLERTQEGDGDATRWLRWFLACHERAIEQSERQVEQALAISRFWQQAAAHSMNDRQRIVVNWMLQKGPGGFKGGMTNKKYRNKTKTTDVTAKRDIAGLVAMGILRRNPGGGRSTSYDLVWPDKASRSGVPPV